MPDPSSNSQPTGSAVDADIASVRRLIDGVFSKLLDEERAARASYVVVQDQFTKNEQMIQQLQRENDAALNNKLQLRETWEAAREKRRQVKHQLQSMARENTPMSDENFNPSPQQQVQREECRVGRRSPLAVGDSAVTGTTNPHQHDEAGEDVRPGTPLEGPAAEQLATRRSTRRRRHPRRLSLGSQTRNSSPDRDESQADLTPPMTRKRKRDATNQAHDDQRGQKSRRTEQTEGAPSSQTHEKRTIDFKELSQGRYRHKIIEYPKQSGEWYILKCDKHHQHFGFRQTLTQAFRHLHSKPLHGALPQSTPIAIGELGIRVLNCEAGDVEKNNAAFSTALENGYQVLGQKPPRVSRRARKKAGPWRKSGPRSKKKFYFYSDDSDEPDEPDQPDQPDQPDAPDEPDASDDTDDSEGADEEPFTQQIPPTSSPFDVITNPEVGKLYIGLRPNLRVISHAMSRWSAAIILPLGSLQTVGLQGSIYDTRLTMFRIPVCYDRDKRTRDIRGWAKGYEDGGAQVAKRKVPVLFFDDDDDRRIPLERGLVDPSHRYLAWLSVGSIRPFSEYDPEGKPPLGYDAALEFSQGLEATNVKEPVRGDPTPDATSTVEPQVISRERRGTSDATNATNGTENNEHGPRPKSAMERRHPLNPANRGVLNRSMEAIEAVAISSDGTESDSDSDGKAGPQERYYNTGTKGPPPQGVKDGAGGREGNAELQNMPGPSIRDGAGDTEVLHTPPLAADGQRRKNVEVSFDFAPNFHTDVGLMPSTSPSSPEADVDNAGANNNTGVPITESGTTTQTHETPGQTEKFSKVVPGDQNVLTFPWNPNPKPVHPEERDALAAAHAWRRHFGEEASERANVARDPPASHSPLSVGRPSVAETASQATTHPNSKPWDHFSAGLSRQGVDFQGTHRYNTAPTAATAAQAASFLLAQTQAQQSPPLPPYVQSRFWQATVMDGKGEG